MTFTRGDRRVPADLREAMWGLIEINAKEQEPMTIPTVEERLIRMETKLDLVIERNRELSGDHEGRLRSLERRFWIAMGFALASLAANAGQLVTYLGGGAGG